MDHDQLEQLEKFAAYLRDAKDVFVITGAGISADSGLPTYRGIGGLYNDNDTEDGMPIEEALSATVFRMQPEITWKYLRQIERGARGATHNRAHEILAEWESRFARMWILTQNIDGFHSSAGSRNVIEIHGNMHRLKCTTQSCRYIELVDDYSRLSDLKTIPVCPECGEMARPDVILFEEQLPERAVQTLMREAMDPFDLVITIGTSNYFPYITQPVYEAHRHGVATVEINPTTTAVSDFVDVKLKMGAKEALEQVNGMLGIET